MARGPQRSAVLELARPAVARVAPDELPMLEATATAYFRRSSKDDELLGFGLDDSVVVASLAVLTAAQAVLTFLGTIFVDSVRDKSSEIVSDWVGRMISRWRGGRAGDADNELSGKLPVEQLSQAQLRQVWQIAYDKTLAAGMTSESALLVADAIVGRLGQVPEQ
jgi:hypothetical protein